MNPNNDIDSEIESNEKINRIWPEDVSKKVKKIKTKYKQEKRIEEL